MQLKHMSKRARVRCVDEQILLYVSQQRKKSIDRLRVKSIAASVIVIFSSLLIAYGPHSTHVFVVVFSRREFSLLEDRRIALERH